MSPETLKACLRSIALNDFQVPEGTDPSDLTNEMIHTIGIPDAELRDDLIYMTLTHWITRGVFDSDQAKKLLTRSLDEEHLFYRLGEEGTDSVFTRAFSALVIPPVLAQHRKNSFLSTEEVRRVWAHLNRYLRAERDLRGYVAGKGWAHAVAHTADALGALARCRELGRDELSGLLELIRDTAGTMRSVYTHGEDERLGDAALHALARSELSDGDVVAWLESFRQTVQHVGAQPLPEGFRGFVNLKHFLRALYFRLHRAHEREVAVGTIEGLLDDFSRL